MKISISTDEVLYKVRESSHNELEVLYPDPEVRYHIEASSDKVEVIRDCMDEAYDSVAAVLYRFIDYSYPVVDSTLELQESGTQLPDYYEFSILASERRLAGKEDVMRNTIKDFLVQRTLGCFYARNGSQDLAGKWNAMAELTGERMKRLLYRKQPPKINNYILD